MMKQFKGFLFLLSLLFLSISCAELNTQDEQNGSNGSNALITLSNEPEGSNCPYGGKKVEAGLDENGNGVLDPEEIDETQTSYVCNGIDGAAAYVSINAGAETADSASVTLNLVASSSVGIAGYYASESNLTPDETSAWAEFTPVTSYAANINFDLSGDSLGVKNIYVWYKDASEDLFFPVSDSIERIVANSSKELLSFWFSAVSNPDLTNDVIGEIDQSTDSVQVTLPYQASVMGLKASFLSSGDRVDVSGDEQYRGITEQDFDSSITYRVVAADGSTQDYDVSVDILPRYTDHGDSTVTDNSTGLMWQQCSIGLSGAGCSSGTIVPTNWYVAAGVFHSTDNVDVDSSCGGSLRANYSDWRLPNKNELFGIVKAGSAPTIDEPFFPNTFSSYYWTSTSYAPNSSYAWNVYFSNGGVGYGGKGGVVYVRCVR